MARLPSELAAVEMLGAGSWSQPCGEAAPGGRLWTLAALTARVRVGRVPVLGVYSRGTWAEMGLEGSRWSLGERPPPGWGLGAFTAEAGLGTGLGQHTALVVPLEVAGGPFLLRQVTS